jgi:hypothetical protein
VLRSARAETREKIRKMDPRFRNVPFSRSRARAGAEAVRIVTERRSSLTGRAVLIPARSVLDAPRIQCSPRRVLMRNDGTATLTFALPHAEGGRFHRRGEGDFTGAPSGRSEAAPRSMSSRCRQPRCGWPPWRGTKRNWRLCQWAPHPHLGRGSAPPGRHGRRAGAVRVQCGCSCWAVAGQLRGQLRGQGRWRGGRLGAPVKSPSLHR